MEKACINHPEEKAVGICGGCGAPTCYRCSMNVDQMVYCSLECFNQLNPPSSLQIPKIQSVAPEVSDVSSDRLTLPLDDLSDVLTPAAPARPPVPAPAPAPVESAPVSLEDPSVILSAALAEEASTMSFPRVQTGAAGEDSTLVIIPGTRRSILSSSCFFHPDTSAIVLCAECRNPICSLCARETEGGLACSPSCGPADPAREDDRKKDLFLTALLAGGVLLVLAGGAFILRMAGHVQAMGTVAAAPAAALTETEPAPSPRPTEAATTAPAEPADPAPREAVLPEAAPPPLPPIVLPRRALPRPEPAVLPLVEATPEPASEPAPVRTAPAEPVRPPALPAYRKSPEPPKLTPYEHDVRWASALLGEATPIVREVSSRIGPDGPTGAEVYALSVKLDRAVIKLRQARELYVRRIGESPDRGALEDRIAAISDTLKAAQEGFERLGGVPQWRR
jgi:hypothetical protein